MGLIHNQKTYAQFAQTVKDPAVLEALWCCDKNLGSVSEFAEEVVPFGGRLSAAQADTTDSRLVQLCNLVVHKGKEGIDNYGYSAAQMCRNKEAE